MTLARGWNSEPSVRGRRILRWPRCVVIDPTPLQVLAFDGLRGRHDETFVGAQDRHGTMRVVALDFDQPAAMPQMTQYALWSDGYVEENLRPDQTATRHEEDETANAA